MFKTFLIFEKKILREKKDEIFTNDPIFTFFTPITFP